MKFLNCVVLEKPELQFVRNWFYLAFVSLLATLAAPSQAVAQNIDWLVNVDDSVTPAPAGGLLEVPITVTNNGFDAALGNIIEIVVPADTTFESFSGTITDCLPIPATAGATVTCIRRHHRRSGSDRGGQ